MKKFRSGIMALVIGLSISVPVSAEITVPDEVKKMSGEEGYRRGYEDALKKNTASNTSTPESSIEIPEGMNKIGDVLKLNEIEVTITKTERVKSRNNKDAIRVFLEFKNLEGKDKSPNWDFRMKAFQEGVELESSLARAEDNQWLKDVKAGGTLKKVCIDFDLESDAKEVVLDIGEFAEQPKYQVFLEME